MPYVRRLPVDAGAVARFAEELWLPYNRDLEAAVESHALADDVSLADEIAYRLELLETDTYRAWVAVDGTDDPDVPLAAVDGALVGFITTDVERSPPVFDQPDRLKIGDIYVRESHRGTGLARRLVDRAVERASDASCSEVSLDVDVDNERALAFYEKLGFEPHRHYMTVPVDEL